MLFPEMRFAFILFLVMLFTNGWSHGNPSKILAATKISDQMIIDGVLDENIWQNANPGSDFIQTEPIPGNASVFQTQVYFLYDDNAIYIGARMADPEPKKILKELSIRDQTGNADNFAVFLDPFNSGLHGFLFLVTASGVQLESVVTNHEEDTNWNAVWESAVSQDSAGWYAEFRIPYSSIRFPSAPIQTWNVQFGREIRRIRESSNWSYIDPNIAGWVQQSGKVTNIENITTPVRLSLTPYISGYVNTTHDPHATNDKSTSSTAYSAGLDLKYGINDAFTLDMTLIPDFGQVISDKNVLNLTPFEVFFEENRQFFTEGTELFNKGNIFYSRRIGGQPLHYNSLELRLQTGQKIRQNPETSQLINATKISGRTSKGTGIGFFNSIVDKAYAIVENQDGSTFHIQTNPLTNYNAIVVDQNLKNNSFVSIMNTNVHRFGLDYDANVTGTFFNIKTKDQKYYIEGSGAISQKFFAEQTERGHTYNVSIGKISGIWTYLIAHGLESDKYNPNDMGFLYSPNEKSWYAEGGYTQYKPKNPKRQQVKYSIYSNYTRLYKPNLFSDFNITIDNFIMLKSRFAYGFNTRLEPVKTFDFFEPRTTDFSKFMTWPQNYTLGSFVSSDYRKPFAYDIKFSYRFFNFEKRNSTQITLSPRMRFNDRFSLFINSKISIIHFEPGYVNRQLVDTTIPDLNPEDILFGHRNRLIFDNALTAKYIFNSKMGINLRVRHYWDKVRYQRFGKLADDGFVQFVNYDGSSSDGSPIFDRNVNIFNVDLQYNWRFAPGSDIYFVWKNQIYSSDKAFEKDYLQNLGGVFNSYQSNNFSIRVLYFLDYLYLFPRKENI